MLADLVLINPDSVNGSDGKNMPRTIELFARILDGKVVNDKIVQKITQCMQNLKTKP